MTGSRAHPRYAIEIDAELGFGERRIPARTRNVSHGGLAIVAAEPAPVGELIVVTLALVFETAKSEALPLRGRVVWCSPIADGTYQIGVVFVAVRAEERANVDMFLRYLRE
jgi:Tfp pilus assembly protein PilZ